MSATQNNNNNNIPSSAVPSSRLSRDEYKQRKALEEARKAGTALPEQDETGKDINPHIPEYIARAPWYLSKGVPSLSHQKSSLTQHEEDLEKGWYNRGRRKATVVTKYRKGACENCGALTHSTRDCVERPRRRGAKLTGEDLETDEIVDDVNIQSFDGKRDRWNGYDPSSYNQVFDHYKQLETERRKKKALELSLKQQEKLKKQEEQSKKEEGGDENDVNGDVDDSDSDSDTSDEDRENDAGATYAKRDPRTKSTIRNLRIREDVAKYLINLDPNSAYYDPKTRSMRENPLPHMDQNEMVYAGDNQMKRTGEWKDFVNIQRYAWEAGERGQDVNFLGAPSQAELSFKTFKEKQEQLANMRQKAILQAYGGEEYLKNPEEDALTLHEKEVYVQFSRDGKIVGGHKKAIPQSKYPEDVFENGHTSVWGSYWKDGKWGYACCKGLNRAALCTASDELDPLGITSVVEQQQTNGNNNNNMATSSTSVSAPSDVTVPTSRQSHRDNGDDGMRRRNSVSDDSSSDSYSDSSSSSSDARSSKRRKKRKSRKDSKRKHSSGGKRKRGSPERGKDSVEKRQRRNGYNSQYDNFTVTEEEMEDYRRERARLHDPMANYIDKSE